jgi:hypothetical protein
MHLEMELETHTVGARGEAHDNSGSAQPQLDFSVVPLNNLSQLVSASETRGPFQCALIQGQGHLKVALRGELARDGI